LVSAAQELMGLLDASGSQEGKYVVGVLDSQGVQIGDGNSQTNRFGGTRVRTGRDAYVAGGNLYINGPMPQPADVVAAAGMNNLPRPPAAVFVGRESAMARLQAALSGQGSAVVTQAVHGLGGVGKSELALQFAHHHRDLYQVIWWVTADNAARAENGLAALAGRLCPEFAATATTAEAAEWAVTWLQVHAGWLLVLDNVTDPADIRSLLGQLHGGHILLTTRRDIGWHKAAAPVRLDVLDPSPAVELITDVTGQASPANRKTAAEIASELGFLPLALDQAAAYIVHMRITLDRYMGLLRQHPARMHAAVPEGTDAQRTINRIWDITLDAMRQASYPAVSLLHVIACYAPDSIPRVLFTDSADDDALGLLASYSMITLTPDAVSIHRLLQAVILAQPGTGDLAAAGARENALRRLTQAIPGNLQTDVTGWPVARAISTHIDSLASQYPPGDEPAALGSLLSNIGVFHRTQGAYQRAHDLCAAALAITEAALGPDHPDTARRQGNLAATYNGLGQYADALPLARQALAIIQAARGPNHPDTALRLANLATTYRHLGRYADALPLAKRALAVTEAVHGPDHPDTAQRLGSLAAILSALGQYTDALSLEQRALAITEAALGPTHPDTAMRLGNLSSTHSDLRRYADALRLEQRCLTIMEAALGRDHPDIGRRLGHLAAIYRALGQHAMALSLGKRALTVTEAALGPDHPDTGRRLDNLAIIYRDQGNPGAALPLARRAVAVTEAALGPEHPTIARELGNLASIYRALGQYTDALPLGERALAITEAVHGPDHPDTAWQLSNLAATYRHLGRHADALSLEERALAVTEARSMPGPRHSPSDPSS
jgi:tetratricopeptide (TPR) repeat protein